jgi:hypothetical protein
MQHLAGNRISSLVGTQCQGRLAVLGQSAITISWLAGTMAESDSSIVQTVRIAEEHQMLFAVQVYLG